MTKRTLLLILVLIGINYSLFAQLHDQCHTDETMMGADNDPSRANYSPNGKVHTPKGHLHGLMIFVNFTGDTINDNGWTDNIPDWANQNDNEMFNSTIANIGNKINVSSFFKAMSNPANPFLFTADVFPEQIIVNRGSELNINSSVFQYLSTNYPNYNWGKYDNRKNKNSFSIDNSSSSPDNILDYVILVYKGGGGYQGKAEIVSNSSTPHTLSTNFGGVNKTYIIGSGFTAINSNNTNFRNFFYHEFGHTLYDAPHTYGPNGVVGNKFYSSNGWGMMNGANAFHTANAWERWYLGWLELTTGPSQIISDINSPADLLPTNGFFILRDFVTTGDVVRVKIPYTQNQYLWIENRTGATVYDNRDGWAHDGVEDPLPNPARGIVMFIENVAGERSKTSVFTSGANGLKVLNGSGHFDYTHSALPTLPEFWWGKTHVYDFNKTSPNPFGPHHNGSNIRSDFYTRVNTIRDFTSNDGIIEVNLNPNNPATVTSEQFGVLVEGGNKVYGPFLPDIAFPVGRKASISSNPAIINLQTYDLNTRKLSPIYLHGLSVRIVSKTFQDNSITVEIKYDDFNINENTRWCGEIILPPNPDQFSPSLIVNANKHLTLNKTETPNRNTLNTNGDFFNPTTLTVQSGAFIELKNNSILEIKEESTFTFKSGSKLLIGGGASFIVREGSKLIIEEGAQIIVSDFGKILIEGSESEMHYANSSIQLAYANSILEINKGKLFVAANTDFTFTGEGFMRFICDQDNMIIGGIGSRFIVNGSGQNNKKIEVLEGSLKMILQHSHPYLSKGFPLTIKNASVHLGEGAKIVSNSILNLNNAKFTSTTGAKNYHYGLHASVDLDHNISNVIFEYGQYGMYSVLAKNTHSNYAEKINIRNCIFRNNEIGLVTVGQGADLEFVQFSNNSVRGWSAEGMTISSDFKNSSVQNSPIGINYIGGPTADLNINYSSVSNSTDKGIAFYGNALLSVNCSNINSANNNFSKGIYLADKASINMSPSLSPSSGKSIVSGHTSIYGGELFISEDNGNSVGKVITAGAANELFLEDGRNDLRPKSSQGMAIKGHFNFDSCPSSISATFNKWNSFNSSPVNGVDYHVRSPICINTNVTIIDNNPGSASCPAIGRPRIRPAFFYKAMEIAEANQGGPNSIFKKFERGLNKLDQNDFISAINEFKDVLLVNVAQPTPLAKKVIGLSYQYLHYSVGKAYSEGLITNSGSQMNSQIESLISIQNNKINKAILESDFNTQYSVKVDKAKTLVLADKRTDALALFYENYLIADSSNFAELDNWICIVSKEQDLIDGNIELNDFAENLNYCQNQLSSSNRVKNEDDQESKRISVKLLAKNVENSKISGSIKPLENKDESLEEANVLIKKPVFNLFPNPTSGKFTIQASNIHTIRIYNLLGNFICEYKPNTDYSQFEIDFTKNAKGVYVIKVSGENYSEIKKLIHQ
ncbi:MAG: T9SS type A sorting domain-containing protein [Bacteroidetes bacterium]|nr:T9SS type A sorting domain-containing protein [Bacteroidota bacterium]HET6244228.1 T9SS type A sorting domain-containing protein [Bacteroidia bacterium]